jgi:hypothetical protein
MCMGIWWLLMGDGLEDDYGWGSDPNPRFCHKLKQHTRLPFSAKKAVFFFDNLFDRQDRAFHSWLNGAA